MSEITYFECIINIYLINGRDEMRVLNLIYAHVKV